MGSCLRRPNHDGHVRKLFDFANSGCLSQHWPVRKTIRVHPLPSDSLFVTIRWILFQNGSWTNITGHNRFVFYLIQMSRSISVELHVGLVCLMLNVPVYNFSVMLGRSHRFLCITSTFFFSFFFFLGGGVTLSCSRTQNCNPNGARTLRLQ